MFIPKRVSSWVGVIVLFASIVGCSIREPKGNLNGFSAEVYSILSNRCFQCHAGGNAEGDLGIIDNANLLIAAGYVVPQSASGSALYNKITIPEFGAKMPFGGPYLSEDEVGVISDWINGLPPASSTCVPHITGGTPSFANDVKPLLEVAQNGTPASRRCVNCHKTGGSAATRLVLSTDGGTTTTHALVTGAGAGLDPFVGRIVVPGSPCTSRLYMRINMASGPDTSATSPSWSRMPKSAATYFTNAQQAIIYTWILNGAPNN